MAKTTMEGKARKTDNRGRATAVGLLTWVVMAYGGADAERVLREMAASLLVEDDESETIAG